jgi:hypothetical protein
MPRSERRKPRRSDDQLRPGEDINLLPDGGFEESVPWAQQTAPEIITRSTHAACSCLLAALARDPTTFLSSSPFKVAHYQLRPNRRALEVIKKT